MAGNYCAAQSPKHQFCADFDENPIGFGWSSVDDNPSISLAPDPIASSPPTSVRSRVLVSKSCTRAMLNNTFADPYVEAHFAFDLRVGGESSSFDGIYVASLEVGKCNHLIQVVSSKLAVYTQIDFPAGEDRQSTTVSVKPDAWMRVSLDIDRADGSIAFSVDGQPAIAKTVVDARCVGRAEVKMRVGLYCQNAPAELRFDNVTFDGR